MRPRLGVNVDHVATVREARGTQYPDPVKAAMLAEQAGCDQITVHLRLDHRHIQPRDVRVLRETVQTRLNLEIAATDDMLDFANEVEPDTVTLVPERREEQTTEGGLDVDGQRERLEAFAADLDDSGAHLSLFIDPQADQIRASAEVGAEMVELHTGDFCDAAEPYANKHTHDPTSQTRLEEFNQLRDGAELAAELGLDVAAGHGLNIHNVTPIAAIPEFEEFNIGHSIVSRSVYVGFEQAVTEMIETLEQGRIHGWTD
jgi:pyridoxine 5-phosphate synthase